VLEDGDGPGHQGGLAAMGFGLFQNRHQRFLNQVFRQRGLEHHHSGMAKQALPKPDAQGPGCVGMSG